MKEIKDTIICLQDAVHGRSVSHSQVLFHIRTGQSEKDLMNNIETQGIRTHFWLERMYLDSRGKENYQEAQVDQT